MKIIGKFLLVYGIVSLTALLCSEITGNSASHSVTTNHWSQTRRDSAHLLDDPNQVIHTAIVAVFAAKTYGWRGRFAVHTWLVFKRAGDDHYTRYEVVGWGPDAVIRRNYAIADGYWFGARPHLLVEYRGATAEAMIGQLNAAVNSYPYPHTYRAWPGPNSNTFIAHIAREVPQLSLNMPANAIGKDYRPLRDPIGRPPSGSGFQFSLLGVLGVNIGRQEGLEMNLLGVDLGINFFPLQLRLPFMGNIPTQRQP
ncbi:DUF3750 domain-containing protein [Rosenbergiella australiborealis]|uniref:DUF3750 domain-containing protein n=1 Tax=Rosenbergiella australiborealis TaxID=1544696 RepID=UPI003B846827